MPEKKNKFNIVKSKRFLVLVLAFICVTISSCNQQEFVKTETATEEMLQLDSLVSFSNPMKINSFSLTYNPKSNGYVKLILENGDTYEAKSVEGGSFSSIHSLLKEKTVEFDTIRKEIVFLKDIEQKYN